MAVAAPLPFRVDDCFEYPTLLHPGRCAFLTVPRGRKSRQPGCAATLVGGRSRGRRRCGCAHRRPAATAARWARFAAAPGDGRRRGSHADRGHMTIPVAQASVSHEWGARRMHSRQRFRRARAAATTPAAPARGSTKREDKDSLTVGSRTAFRRLARRGEDRDSPTFLIFPHRTTPPRRLPRLRRPRRAMSAFSPLVDLEAERATGRKGMVMRGKTVGSTSNGAVGSTVA